MRNIFAVLLIFGLGTAAQGAEPVAHGERQDPAELQGQGAVEVQVEPEPGAGLWPQPNQVHPAVLSLAREDETSLKAVADRLVRQEPELAQRVKAVHDWVVTRLAYSHRAGEPQDAASVFSRRTAKCEGYARLFAALCTAVGVKAEYITGLALEEGASTPAWHAWNAVQLDGRWQLVDPTFDDPTISGDAPAQNYRSDYLFIPPEVAVLDHFPDKERWQLKPKPLPRREFLNPRRNRPALVRQGLTLLSPLGSVSAQAPVSFRLANAGRRFVLVTLDGVRCGIDSGEQLRIDCPAPGPGAHRVQVLTNRSATGFFLSVLSFEIDANDDEP